MAIQLGEPTDSVISKEDEGFYERVARFISGDHRCHLLNSGRIRTISVPQANVGDGQTLYSGVFDRIATWNPVPDFIIADLLGSPLQTIRPFNLLQALTAALDRQLWAKNFDGITAVLLAQAISDHDLALDAVRSRLERGLLAIIDPAGRLYGNLPNTQFRPEEYHSALMERREDPFALIQRKFIRRIGHFRLPRGYWTKFFYDGSFCRNEIVRLLRESDPTESRRQLLVYAPLSPWLRDAAEMYSLSANKITITNLAEFIERGSSSRRSAPEIQSKPTVLVPMVDTGSTIKKIQTEMRRLNPNSSPEYVTVLSTAGDKPYSGRREVADDAQPVNVRYFLRVDRSRLKRSEEPSCVRKHGGSSFDINSEPLKLTSYAFWQMVSEAGFKTEADVPKWRGSLGLVPRFPEILRSNGPLLAFKLNKLLRDENVESPVDIVLICPEQAGAIEVTECVRAMFKSYSVVRIPEEVYQDSTLDGAPAAVKNWLLQHHGETEWWKRLQSATQGKSTRAVLVDEFLATGRTLKRLEQLCDAAGLAVHKEVTLVNFTTSNNRSIKALSLYDIPVGVIS